MRRNPITTRGQDRALCACEAVIREPPPFPLSPTTTRLSHVCASICIHIRTMAHKQYSVKKATIYITGSAQIKSWGWMAILMPNVVGVCIVSDPPAHFLIARSVFILFLIWYLKGDGHMHSSRFASRAWNPTCAACF